MKNLDLSKFKIILDAGGWYNPNVLATHVADLYPYETRRAQLAEHPSPIEKFSKSTWIQADFCDPTLRLPFEDKSVDFVICSHTLEDLREPSFLITEMSRIGKQGYIEVPSRFAEQTIGVSDRAAKFQGWNHHKWIVDFEDQTLVFNDKLETLYGPEINSAIPLTVYERLIAEKSYSPIIEYVWEGQISFRISKASDLARARAKKLVDQLQITTFDRSFDGLMRLGRRLRNRALRKDDLLGDNIREVSQRYSVIDLS